MDEGAAGGMSDNRFSFDMPEDKIEKFWKSVDRSGDCWLWCAGKDSGGYGVFSVGHVGRKAHRISWFLANGRIPEWADVCHTCDVTNCVNPAHLFLGTARDNILDMERKGRARHPRGEEGGRAKLTEQDVRRIRDAAFAKHGDKVNLAREVGISRAVVWAIRQRKTWRHVE